MVDTKVVRMIAATDFIFVCVVAIEEGGGTNGELRCETYMRAVAGTVMNVIYTGKLARVARVVFGTGEEKKRPSGEGRMVLVVAKREGCEGRGGQGRGGQQRGGHAVKRGASTCQTRFENTLRHAGRGAKGLLVSSEAGITSSQSSLTFGTVTVGQPRSNSARGKGTLIYRALLYILRGCRS